MYSWWILHRLLCSGSSYVRQNMKLCLYVVLIEQVLDDVVILVEFV